MRSGWRIIQKSTCLAASLVVGQGGSSSGIAELSSEEVAAKSAASPDLGPEHPDTLASRHLLAQVLDSLGRLADASINR